MLRLIDIEVDPEVDPLALEVVALLLAGPVEGGQLLHRVALPLLAPPPHLGPHLVEVEVEAEVVVMVVV